MTRVKKIFVVALGALALVLGGLATATAAAPSGDTGKPQKEGECTDGVDNDDDGLTDAEDPACQKPGCLPSTQTPQKCREDADNPPVETDDCEDGLDNDNDGLTDTDDPDCQPGGSGDETNDDTPETDDCEDGLDNDNDGLTDTDDPDCQPGGSGDETNDDTPDADDCTASAGDPGLITPDTLGQTLSDAGLSGLSPLLEDPDADGPLSGTVKSLGEGSPLEVLTDEVGCVVDLPIDEVLGLDL